MNYFIPLVGRECCLTKIGAECRLLLFRFQAQLSTEKFRRLVK